MTGRTVFRVLSLLALFGWMAVIFWFSAQNAETSSAMSCGLIEQVAGAITPGFAELPEEEQIAVVDQWQNVVRKGAHMAEYAVLGALTWIAASGWIRRYRIRAAVATVVGLLYATGDEIHQAFVPGRGPGVLDVGIDFIGVCIGLAAAAGVTALWRRRKTRKQA